MLTLTLDIDELPNLSIPKLRFSQGRRSILSVRPTDYLAVPDISEDLSLRERVEMFLKRSGEELRPARITLVTMPRYFGYVFNPVSFFYCFDDNDKLFALVTQVNNTFGETHIYPLRCTARDLPVEWKFSKEFFVSPFFSRDGEYTLRADAVDEQRGLVRSNPALSFQHPYPPPKVAFIPDKVRRLLHFAKQQRLLRRLNLQR
jgi:cyclopropane-fatty-acyl-phospholipid synthase